MASMGVAMSTVNCAEKRVSTRRDIMDAVINDILPWIEENLFDESLRIKSVTARSGYGHWHFQRLFRQHTGINLATYIRVRRIIRAAFSVALSDKGIFDIAIENGFSSQQNFSRTFKEYLNLSPIFFRQACSGQEAAFRQLTLDLHRDYAFLFFR